jgi:hypothetical protein
VRGISYRDKTMAKCPDCRYYLAETMNGRMHCYNCDEEKDVASTPIIINNLEKWLDEGAPSATNDTQSLAASLTETTMQRVTDATTPPSTPAISTFFPYALDDLKYWVVKRKTGEIVRYTLTPDATVPSKATGNTTVLNLVKPVAHTAYSLGEWCKHDPKPDPVWAHKGKKGGKYPLDIKLFIADAPGARAHKEKFDFCIDGGDVISDIYAERSSSILSGDADLATALDKYTLSTMDGPRVLKVAWNDRKAPFLHPEFWGDFASLIYGNVLTICQGGHGRSGTSLVCLMMVLNPEYGAADAITHLRAMHCPRAIESYEQHGYIDEVADFLKRKADSSSVHSITNFKEAFLKLDRPSAKPYQTRLKEEMEKAAAK